MAAAERELHGNGWSHKRVRIRDAALAVACLTVISIGLRIVRLRRLLRTLTAWQRSIPDDQSRDRSSEVKAMVRALGAAGALFPLRALCLERSLALLTLLSVKRVPGAALQIGVTPYGFAAHAWITYRGEPVNERPDNVKEFVPFSLN